MTKAELVTMVAEKADLTKKDAEKAISALVESILRFPLSRQAVL